RWGELIESSRLFAAKSGLEKDANRSEIINIVNEAISESGLSEKTESLLCMLGESVVVVPKDPNSRGDWMGPLSEVLRESGLSYYSSKVGQMM
ncbi:MAG: hypothetical protein CMA88_05055, partial [Euryarchaeota archaeon]|nr:hypothetical protein [Euryarchaeota archaeon]